MFMRNSWGTSGMPHCPKVRSQDGWNPFWIGFVWKFRVLSTSNHWSMLIMIISLIFNDIHRYTIQLYIYICPFYLFFIYLCIICFWLWSNPVGICHKKKVIQKFGPSHWGNRFVDNTGGLAMMAICEACDSEDTIQIYTTHSTGRVYMRDLWGILY